MNKWMNEWMNMNEWTGNTFPLQIWLAIQSTDKYFKQYSKSKFLLSMDIFY